MEILKNITKDFAAIEKIEKQLFNVEMVQLHPNLEGYEVPTASGIYEEGGKRLFGVVGANYMPTQPKLLFEALVSGMLESNLDVEHLKYSELKGGAKIRFNFPLGKIKFKNKKGKMDESTMFGNLQTGFDGRTKSSFYLSVFREICSNGMKASVTEFSASFKNTKGNVGKASVLVDDLMKVQDRASTLEELMIALNNKKVTKKEQDKFIEKVTSYKVDEYAKMSKRSQNIVDSLRAAINQEFERTGATAWGLFNGITNYTNHYATAESREDYLYSDSGVGYNDRALKFAQQLLS